MAWDRRDTAWALGAAGLALAARAVASLQAAVVGADAHAYTLGALEIARGEWAPSFLLGVHPGYPVAIALFASVMDVETAGVVVAALAASLSVVPFYAFVRDLGDATLARAAALLYALLPRFVLEQSDILTEGLFHLFFLSTVALSWLGLTKGRVWTTLAAGAAGGLAYWTRPEGAYAPLLILGLAALARARGRTLAAAAGACAIFLLLALPLLLAFRNVSGEWTLSPRESVRRITQGGPAPAGWPRATAEAAEGLARVTQGSALLALAGFAAWRPTPPARSFLLCLFVGYLGAPLAARAAGHGLSTRHLLLPALFLVPWMISGARAILARLASRWPGAPRAAVVAFALLLLAGVPIFARPRRERERPIMEAALQLRDSAPPGGQIFSNTFKAAHYLRRRVRQLRDEPEAVDALRLGPADRLLVVEEALEKDAPGGVAALEARFERLARFPAEGVEGTRVSIFAQPAGSRSR